MKAPSILALDTLRDIVWLVSSGHSTAIKEQKNQLLHLKGEAGKIRSISWCPGLDGACAGGCHRSLQTHTPHFLSHSPDAESTEETKHSPTSSHTSRSHGTMQQHLPQQRAGTTRRTHPTTFHHQG